jgi:hypothetical protein
MLNRRQLRVKVLQTLYAYHQAENKELKSFEKALINLIESVNEMYFYTLSLLILVADYSSTDAEDRAIEDISLAVRGFFIKSSKWSSSVGEDKVVYIMRENLEYDEEFAED